MNSTLKHYLKKNAFVTKVGYWHREIKTRRQIRALQRNKLENNKILFASGRFGDSLSALAEYLHERDPKLQMIWAYRSGDEKFLKEFPAYITPVLFESQRYYREIATSVAWVFNVLVPQGTCKREGQLYIQVWHGDKPFKKIGLEAAKDKKGYQNQSKGRKFLENELCDYFVTGSRLFIDIWEKSMGYHGKVISSGLPRNDILLKTDNIKCGIIRQELGIPSDVKVLIYAPTFRDHIADNGQIGTNINLSRILDLLESKYQCEWTCLKRSHGGRRLSLEKTADDPRIIDLSKYRDMTNLLLISDMLITDYSSCAGDFAYLNRPVLLYQDDFETYTSLDRGLIFDITKTPFFRAKTMDELESLINSLTEELIKKNCKEILDLYESTQTTHSTEDVAEIIFSHMKKARLIPEIAEEFEK